MGKIVRRMAGLRLTWMRISAARWQSIVSKIRRSRRLRLAPAEACSIRPFKEIRLVQINLPRSEREALMAIDTFALSKAVDRLVEEGIPGYTHRLELHGCGAFVQQQLHYLDRALSDLRAAKSDKKRLEMLSRARDKAGDLIAAVQQMQHRAETEMEEGKLFQVDEPLGQPFHLSARMSVVVSYRWRKTEADDWNYGRIEFTHVVDTRPDFSRPVPARKPSRAQQSHERQDELYRVWERLALQAHGAVQKYFRQGMDGSGIPKTFQVIPNTFSRGLDNHSADFWLERQ